MRDDERQMMDRMGCFVAALGTQGGGGCTMYSSRYPCLHYMQKYLPRDPSGQKGRNSGQLTSSVR